MSIHEMFEEFMGRIRAISHNELQSKPGLPQDNFRNAYEFENGIQMFEHALSAVLDNGMTWPEEIMDFVFSFICIRGIIEDFAWVEQYTDEWKDYMIRCVLDLPCSKKPDTLRVCQRDLWYTMMRIITERCGHEMSVEDLIEKTLLFSLQLETTASFLLFLGMGERYITVVRSACSTQFPRYGGLKSGTDNGCIHKDPWLKFIFKECYAIAEDMAFRSPHIPFYTINFHKIKIEDSTPDLPEQLSKIITDTNVKIRQLLDADTLFPKKFATYIHWRNSFRLNVVRRVLYAVVQDVSEHAITNALSLGTSTPLPARIRGKMFILGEDVANTYEELLRQYLMSILFTVFTLSSSERRMAKTHLPKCSFIDICIDTNKYTGTSENILRDQYHTDIQTRFRNRLVNDFDRGFAGVFGVSMDAAFTKWLDDTMWQYRDLLDDKVPIERTSGEAIRYRLPSNPLEFIIYTSNFEATATPLPTNAAVGGEVQKTNTFTEFTGPLSVFVHKPRLVTEDQLKHNQIIQHIADLNAQQHLINKPIVIGSGMNSHLTPCEDDSLMAFLMSKKGVELASPLSNEQNPYIIVSNYRVLKFLFSRSSENELVHICGVLLEHASQIHTMLFSSNNPGMVSLRSFLTQLVSFKRSEGIRCIRVVSDTRYGYSGSSKHREIMLRYTDGNIKATTPSIGRNYDETVDLCNRMRDDIQRFSSIAITHTPTALEEEDDPSLRVKPSDKVELFNSPILPDTVLRIDASVFDGRSNIECDENWVNYVIATGIVPCDIRDFRFHSSEPPLFVSGRNGPLCNFVVHGNNGRMGGIERLSFPDFVISVEKNKAPFNASIKDQAMEWYAHLENADPKAYHDPQLSHEILDETYGAYYESRLGLWGDADRAKVVFAPSSTTGDTTRTFRLPGGDYVAHAIPLHFLSAKYMRNDVYIADHPETAFALYQVFTHLSYNIRHGFSMDPGPIMRLFQEAPDHPGMVVFNHAFYVHDVNPMALSLVFAAKYRGLRASMVDGGLFGVNNARHKTFHERIGGAGSINKMALHEELAHTRDPNNPRPENLKVLISLTNSASHPIQACSWPDSVKEDLADDVLRRYDLQMGIIHNRHNGAEAGLNLAGSTIEPVLCVALAIQRLYDVVQQLTHETSLEYIVNTPLISPFKYQEVLVTFPFLFVDDVSPLKAVIGSCNFGPYIKCKVIQNDLEDKVESVYPIQTPYSHFLFVAQSYHVGSPAEVPFETAFSQPRNVQMEQGADFISRNEVAFDTSKFTKVSIADPFSNDPNMTSILINSPMNATDDFAMAMDTPVDFIIAGWIEFASKDVESIILDDLVLDPCSADIKENRRDCGCPRSMLLMRLCCKNTAISFLQMVNPSIITTFVYHLICAGLMSLNMSEWEMVAITTVLQRVINEHVRQEVPVWSTEFRRKLEDDQMYKRITVKTIAFLARLSTPETFMQHQMALVSEVILREMETDLEMDMTIVDAVAFLAVLDFIGVVTDKYTLMPFTHNRFMVSSNYQNSLMRRVVEPYFIPFLLANLETARDAFATALDAGLAENEPNSPAIAAAKHRMVTWQRVCNVLRRFRSERDLESNVARRLELENFETVRDSIPSIICCPNTLLICEHGKGEQEVIRDAEALIGVPIAATQRITPQSGYPELYITQSTNTVYKVDMNTDHHDMTTVMGLLDQTFNQYENGNSIATTLRLRNFFIRDSSRLFYGINTEKMMRMLLGETGENGKSTIVKFLEETFGDYSTTCKTSIFTTKEQNSSNASPELAKLANMRHAFAAELDETDEYSGAQLKKLTSNDPYEARKLFCAPIIVQPVTRFYTHANNKPVLRTGGVAALRRFLIIPFRSRFVPKYPQSLLAQQSARMYPIVPTLSEKLKKKRPALLRLMVLCYPGSRFATCPEIEAEKALYTKEVDHYNMFQCENLCINEEGSNLIDCSVSEAYARFEEFMKPRLIRNQNIPLTAEFVRGLMALNVVISQKRIRNHRLIPMDEVTENSTNANNAAQGLTMAELAARETRDMANDPMNHANDALRATGSEEMDIDPSTSNGMAFGAGPPNMPTIPSPTM